MRRFGLLAVAAALLAGGCTPASNASRDVLHARFDPDAGVIPMPSDLLRDDDAGQLALPADDPDASLAERELYEFLDTLDGWSIASTASVEFTGAIDATTLTPGNVVVLERRADTTLVKHDAPRLSLSTDGRTLTVDPPLEGWAKGSTLVLALRGREEGIRGSAGELVECDAAFYFLRLTTPLTDPAHERAFPGDSPEERAENAARLEEARLELAPWFDAVEVEGIPRREVAALWAFTTTVRTELTMAKPMRVMPLPIDLLRDPATGKIDLPIYDEDDETERNTKEHLNANFDGFGPTMTPNFEFTAPLDPATVTTESIELWHVTSPPARIEGSVAVSADARRVTVTPAAPLLPRERYVVAVRDTVRDAAGEPIVPMTAGHLLLAKQPVLIGGESTIGAVPLADAQRLEPVRASQAAFLDAIGRDSLAAAWPYTTMDVVSPLVEAKESAERLAVSPDPEDVTSMSPVDAGLDFPIGALTLWRVQRVFNGVLPSPDFLDPATRGRYEDGSHVVRGVPFTLTIPDGAEPDTPLPVVIFGHGLVTERRFVLAVSDALAAKGFAVIAIDFPYHGARSVCTLTGPLCLPDPLSEDGELICPNQCEDGSTCSPDGSCRDDLSGALTPLKTFPVIPMFQATGSAFIEVESLPNTREHFLQTVVDLGALSRSIRLGDWRGATGFTLDGDRVVYLGQSLGGIIGALYAPLDPAIDRAVFNVPGASLVPMFDESLFFRLQVEAYYERRGVELGSADHDRYENIAHWMIDSVDPINVARHITGEPIPEVGAPPGGRAALVQLATLDIIIPEAATMRLVDEAGLPMEDYLGGHGMLLLPVEPAFLPVVNDAADFLEGSWQP